MASSILVSRIYTEILEINKQENRQPNKKMGKRLKQVSTELEMHMGQNSEKPFIGKLNINIPMAQQFHF